MPELGDVLEAESEPNEPEESPPEELLVEEVEELSALEDDSDLVDDELPDPLDDFPPRLSFL